MRVVAGTPGALHRAAELIDAYRAHGPVRVVELDAAVPAWWRGRLDGAAAALLLAPPQRPLADAVAGTHLKDAGRRVPVGVLADRPDALAAAAALAAPGRTAAPAGAATADSAGAREPVSVAVLGDDLERSQILAGDVVGTLSSGGVCARRLTAERLPRRRLATVLAAGPGVALYVGLGSPLGWHGYGGVEAWRLQVPGARPIGAVLAVTCHGATRPGARESFVEELVRGGRARAALGAAGEVDHAQDRALALALAHAVAAGASTLAAALAGPVRIPAGYRIAGDPLASLNGAPGAWAALAGEHAAAPGEPLAPVAWSRSA